MEVKEKKAQFFPFLPDRYVGLIRKRLEKKGIVFGRSYIQQVCDPDSDKSNDFIITEAIMLAAETKLMRDEQQKGLEILNENA